MTDIGLSCGCDCQSLVPRIQVPEGHPDFPFIYPSVDRNGVFTLDAGTLQLFQTPFTGIEGDGIAITDGGTNGHAPTLAVCVDPDSVIPLSFVNVGGRQCLTAAASNAGETTWSSPNTVTANGIRVTTGGTNGHNPSFRLVFAPGAPFAIDSNGRLTFTGDLTRFSCSDLNGCSISALADVEVLNPNPGQILVYGPEGILVNQPANQVVAGALSAGVFTSIPAPPTAGGPYTLQYDPGTGFAWV